MDDGSSLLDDNNIKIYKNAKFFFSFYALYIKLGVGVVTLKVCLIHTHKHKKSRT